MLIHNLLLTLHVLAATVWVGGMACMHFAVRPAAVAVLQPPQRVPFLAAALGRFFSWVTAAIAVILLTGGWMIAQRGGFAALHWSVHAMLALGLVMTAVFGLIRLAAYPRLNRAVAASDWKAAAGQLDVIRRWVAFNLALGTLTFILALGGKAA